MACGRLGSAVAEGKQVWVVLAEVKNKTGLCWLKKKKKVWIALDEKKFGLCWLKLFQNKRKQTGLCWLKKKRLGCAGLKKKKKKVGLCWLN